MIAYPNQDWEVVVFRKDKKKPNQSQQQPNKTINKDKINEKDDKQLNFISTDDAKYITNIRCQLKLTQDELAKQSGVCIHEIKKMERPNSKYVKNNHYNKLRNFLYKKSHKQT